MIPCLPAPLLPLHLPLPLLLLLLLFPCSFPLTVLQANGLRLRHQVWEGSSVTLSCPSPQPWFLCVWHSPGKDRQCGLQNTQGLETVCSNTRLAIRGNSTDCRVTLKVGRGDHGAWTCLLTLAGDFSAQRTWVDLRVATQPKLTLQVELAGELVTLPGQEGGQGLHMMEGQTKQVVCRAEGAYPKPTFLWRLASHTVSSDSALYSHQSSQASLSSQPSSSSPPSPLSLPLPPSVLRSPSHYWVSSSSSLLLSPSLSHHNSSLSCTVLPSTSSLSLLLNVSPLLPRHLPLPSPAISSLPLFPLLLLFAAILLSLGFCLLIVTKRQSRTGGQKTEGGQEAGGEDTREEAMCSVESVQTAVQLVEQLEGGGQLSLLGRRYRGSLATHSEGSTTGERELPSTMEEEEGGSQADTQSDCSQRELEKEQEKVHGQEKSQEQRKERLQSLEQEGDSSSEEKSYQGPSRMCSSCSSSSQPAGPGSASLPLPALTLFQCQEGCFTSTSSFHHQLVAIPAFRPGPWGEEPPAQGPALG